MNMHELRLNNLLFGVRGNEVVYNLWIVGARPTMTMKENSFTQNVKLFSPVRRSRESGNPSNVVQHIMVC